MSAFLQQLNPQYFWDVNLSTLDEHKSKRLIIERIINFGNLYELRLIIEQYGKDEVVQTICNLNYIDPKTLNFFALIFKIPKSKFKCYTRKPSNQVPWTY